jgi:hypothetical protein
MINHPTTFILRKVELFWAKLDKPVNPFNETKSRWEIQIRTRDKSVASEWRDEFGMSPKLKEDDNGTFYQMNLKKFATTNKGEERDPVNVVDSTLKPINSNSLGNGSVGNVMMSSYTYDQAGQAKVGFSLNAIQVTKLVEYVPSAGASFELEGEMEIVVPTDDSGDDNDW